MVSFRKQTKTRLGLDNARVKVVASSSRVVHGSSEYINYNSSFNGE